MEKILSWAVVFFCRMELSFLVPVSGLFSELLIETVRELLFLVFSGFFFLELFVETGKNVLFQFHALNICCEHSLML